MESVDYKRFFLDHNRIILISCFSNVLNKEEGDIKNKKFKNLCEINPKAWKIHNADVKSGNIGETLHNSWAIPR